MSILQYLSTYAEPECACPPPDKTYRHVVVVPAFDESPSFLDGYRSASEAVAGDVLWIIVTNASEGRKVDEIHRTAYLLRALSAGGQELAPGIVHASSIIGDLVLVDRVSEGRRLPARQGVGLARKIGCDLALAWHRQERITSPWIHCSDADVRLPADYFTSARDCEADAELVALSYPFWHRVEPASHDGRALELYEMSLRYYVLGLHWAGSSYAFHSVGSCMALRASAYHQVRGIPKREAGEDFYVLNKLAKLGRVGVPASAPLSIAQRPSQRTPFGTGPATEAIRSQLLRGSEFRVYHPHSFALLREWLDTLEEFARDCKLEVLDGLSRPELRRALPLNTEARLREAAEQGKSPDARRRRLRTWFDGFRTLKLVHALREQGLEDRAWAEAFDAAPFVPEPDSRAGETMRQAMARRERQLLQRR